MTPIDLKKYRYTLPPERIALYPLAERDSSKLLVGDGRTGTVRHALFRDLPELLPEGALLIRNSTKVIAARLAMKKASGGTIEVLCLEPELPTRIPALALAAQASCRWRCVIGGRVKAGQTLSASVSMAPTSNYATGNNPLTLTATVEEKNGRDALVRFDWTPERATFADVLESMGTVPLPPYLKREADAADRVRYQTVYAQTDGSVAAPTAGLHFTQHVFHRLAEKNIPIADVTLHVGLGTFRPIDAESLSVDSSGGAAQHEMHRERIAVSRSTLEQLIEQCQRRPASGGASSKARPVVAVGTTSCRTLESLYWFGVRLLRQDEGAFSKPVFFVGQGDAYRLSAQGALPDATEALGEIIKWADAHRLTAVEGETQLFIMPGYRFHIADALITNFHQPDSTLILLVAAFVGDDLWRDLYETALRDGYRFLSYGDSSLLWR